MGEIAHVQNPVIQHARENGWLVRRIQYIGRRGCPDSIFMKNGRVVFVEFKDLDGKLSLLQEREIKKLRAAGMEVLMIDNAEDGYDFFT